MRATLAIAAAAAMAGSASASDVHRRHAHDLFHGLDKKASYTTKGGDSSNNDTGVCKAGCTTYYTTYYGEATLYFPPTPTSYPAPTAPTPYPQDCPTPGTYTVPAHIVTVTQTTTVTYSSSNMTYTTAYAPGTYTQPAVVTYVSQSSTSFYCPFEIPTPTSTSKSSTSSAAPTSSSSSSSSSAVAVYAASSAVKASSAASSAPASSYPTSKPAAGGAPWGITYTPYDAKGNCVPKDQVARDIAAIAGGGIKLVRVYSTDCNALDSIGSAARANGVKMLVGVYVGTAHCAADNGDIATQISNIKAWAQWDLVEAIVVGNEAIFNGYCSAQQLQTLIHAARAAFAGYSGPYTTAETMNIWQQPDTPAALCSCIDWVGANIHPYFNRAGTADQAGAFVASSLSDLNAMCPGKPARILETGWPHAGNCLGSSCAGKEQQATAISSILAAAGSQSVFLSFIDDLWKAYNDDCGVCEQSWGCRAALGF